MSSVQLGINPLTWTNDDLYTLGDETPLETCLGEGREAGFAGFELGHKFPRDPAQLRPILADYDLQLVSGWFSGSLYENSVEQEIEAVQEHLHLLQSMGCKVMVYCETSHCVHGMQRVPLTRRTPMPANRWGQFAEKLTEFARYTQAQGVQVAYHHHMGTLIQTGAEVDELMQRTGEEVGLLLDSGHLTYAGGDPVTVARRWGSRINHVHCKDIRAGVLRDAKNRDLSFLDAMLNGVFTVPGDGCVNYPAIFSVLKEVDYSGWLVVEAEQDPAIANPLPYARLGHDNLQRMAGDAGLL